MKKQKCWRGCHCCRSVITICTARFLSLIRFFFCPVFNRFFYTELLVSPTYHQVENDEHSVRCNSKMNRLLFFHTEFFLHVIVGVAWAEELNWLNYRRQVELVVHILLSEFLLWFDLQNLLWMLSEKCVVRYKPLAMMKRFHSWGITLRLFGSKD